MSTTCDSAQYICQPTRPHKYWLTQSSIIYCRKPGFGIISSIHHSGSNLIVSTSTKHIDKLTTGSCWNCSAHNICICTVIRSCLEILFVLKGRTFTSVSRFQHFLSPLFLRFNRTLTNDHHHLFLLLQNHHRTTAAVHGLVHVRVENDSLPWKHPRASPLWKATDLWWSWFCSALEKLRRKSWNTNSTGKHMSGFYHGKFPLGCYHWVDI